MPLDRRKKKKHLCSDNSELEEVSPVLRSSSISDEVFEPLQAEETSSKVMKKRRKNKRNQKGNSQMAIDFFISFLFFFKTLRLNFDYK